MSGRKIFQYLRPILMVGTLIFKLFPTFLCRFIWDIVSPFSGLLFTAIRYMLLGSKATIGNNIYIGTNVIIKNWQNFSCGDNFSLHDMCYIDAFGGVKIGNDVSIAHGSSLVSFNHTYLDRDCSIKYNPVESKGILIDNDVWIGCGVRILDGVIIGTRSIVAAGAVVSKAVENNMMVGGIPAKFIKNI